MGINLGNIVEVGGKSVGSGISSGFDAATLIEGLTTAKRIPAVKLEDNITANVDKTSAFNELKTILTDFSTAVDFLRNPPGVNKASNNTFEFRTASLISSTSTAASTYMSATASPGSGVGTFSLAVGNLAEALSTRSTSFTSKTASVTEVAAGSTSGMFSAGTFQYTTTTNTVIGDKLAAADYSVTGSAVGILTAAGINNITDANNDGDSNFMGTVSGFSATVNGTNVDLSVTINGSVYTSTGVPANTGVSTDSIAAGAITFTNATSGTTFDINLTSAYVIAANQTNANTFAAALDTALAPQSVYQMRELGNFDSTKVGGTTLAGLSRDDVELTSNAFNTTNGIHGSFGEFTVTAVSAPTAADGKISIVIDGETYQATGLGTGASDTHTANITLSSTTTSKTFALNISDASITLDLSTTTKAQTIEDDLDAAFGSSVNNVTLTQGDSLVDIAAAINAKSGLSGVVASIIEVSSNDFRLSIKSQKEGFANMFTAVDSTGVMTDVTFSTEQAAENAVISLDGIVLERSTNSIGDVISNLTFDLKKATDPFLTQTAFDAIGTPTLITTTIIQDTDTAKAGIVNFVNAYNAYKVFVATQTMRKNSTGEFEDTAILKSNSSLKNIINQVSSEVNKIVAGVSNSTFSSLASIGITFVDFKGDKDNPEVANILTYDETKLTTALTNNYDSVREIFEFTFNSSNSNLSIFSRTNTMSLTDFKVDIDTTRAVGNKVRILDLSNNFLFNMNDPVGTTISGKTGTTLEGLTLLYTGAGTDVVTVDLSQGIGDRMFNSLKGMIEQDGIVDDALKFISDKDTRSQKEIDKIDADIERYRTELLAQYSALEEAVTRINTLLDFLDANSKSIFKN